MLRLRNQSNDIINLFESSVATFERRRECYEFMSVLFNCSLHLKDIAYIGLRDVDEAEK